MPVWVDVITVILVPGLLWRPIYEFFKKRGVSDDDENNTIFAATIASLALLSGIVLFAINAKPTYCVLFECADQDADLFTKSVECSFSECGSPACIKIYTSSFPSGRNLPAVQAAAANGRKAANCPSAHPNEEKRDHLGDDNGRTETLIISPQGSGNQIGGNNNSLKIEVHK